LPAAWPVAVLLVDPAAGAVLLVELVLLLEQAAVSSATADTPTDS
jgi:hypothetical protein